MQHSYIVCIYSISARYVGIVCLFFLLQQKQKKITSDEVVLNYENLCFNTTLYKKEN